MDKCEHIKNTITENYIGKKDLPADIRTHMVACSSCASYADDLYHVFEALESYSAVEPSDNLIRDTLCKIEEKAVKAREKTLRLKIGLAAVASLPFIIIIHLFWITVIPESVGLFSATWAMVLKHM